MLTATILFNRPSTSLIRTFLCICGQIFLVGLPLHPLTFSLLFIYLRACLAFMPWNLMCIACFALATTTCHYGLVSALVVDLAGFATRGQAATKAGKGRHGFKGRELIITIALQQPRRTIGQYMENTACKPLAYRRLEYLRNEVYVRRMDNQCGSRPYFLAV